MGVATRLLWLVLGTLWEVLVIAFGLGCRHRLAEGAPLRIAGGLLVSFGLLGLAWPFASMHQRQVMAAGQSVRHMSRPPGPTAPASVVLTRSAVSVARSISTLRGFRTVWTDYAPAEPSGEVSGR
jgi:hypothetical protein